MCKAHINIINPKVLHMAASDQLRFSITSFPLAYCGLLAAVKLTATIVYFLFAPLLVFCLYATLFILSALMRSLF
jgi:hypothetical protein